MTLRSAHLGYAFQDLMAANFLVEVAIGTASQVAIDVKNFPEDPFDDIAIVWTAGGDDRLQIKHTSSAGAVPMVTFSGERRGLSLDRLVTAADRELGLHPGTHLRVVMRDLPPEDPRLLSVLHPVARDVDPGPAVPGMGGSRWQFNADAVLTVEPWSLLVSALDSEAVRRACAVIVVDLGIGDCSMDMSQPGEAEHLLLRRAAEDLGAGRAPNGQRSPHDVALALTATAQAVRAGRGSITSPDLMRRLDLVVDFGAVAEGHPVEKAVEVHRPTILGTLNAATSAAAGTGGRVVVDGGPGVGKSWLCEQLSEQLRGDGWIVARHHCWLGASDVDREHRVKTDVVLGSVLHQLELIAPESVASIRPRFAATAEVLEAALATIRQDHPDRRVAVIIDGIDHVTRVRGRVEGGAFALSVDPADALVAELVDLALPPGVALVLASQPGAHLAAADVTPVSVPPMDWDEVRQLADRLGVLAATQPGTVEPGVVGPERRERTDAVVDLVLVRSGGNALYATYLCRQAVGSTDTAEADGLDALDRIQDVPASASDLNDYYAYLLGGLTNEQRSVVRLLAVCDFGVTAKELGEIVPIGAGLLREALATVAPVVVRQPGVGGLRIHHESFSRFIRAADDENWITEVRKAAAEWLRGRGFFRDARAFRHLPELLVDLARDDEVADLVEPDFLTSAVAGLQPPAAIAHTLSFIARRAAAVRDWTTLLRCVELRRAADTFEWESLPGTLVEHADLIVALLGSDAVTTALLYDGVPTVAPRWGLQLCAAVDAAGAVAPWDAYLAAWDRRRDREGVDYGRESDDAAFLAELRGSLRARTDDDGEPMPERIASFLDQEGLPPLVRVLDTLLDGLDPSQLLAAVPLIDDRTTRARTLLRLASCGAARSEVLPSSRSLAVAAWATADGLDPQQLLEHGVAGVDLAADLLGDDPEHTLRIATDAVLSTPNVSLPADLRRWLGLVAVAQDGDPLVATRLLAQVSGPGFFRGWMRFSIATLGIAADLTAGRIDETSASAAARVAIDELAAATGLTPSRRLHTSLFECYTQIHNVVRDAIALLISADLGPAIEALNAVSDGTTSSIAGTGGTGPLITTDLIEIVARTVDAGDAGIVSRLMQRLRDDDRHSLYPETADLELAMARIWLVAGDREEARTCWVRAARYMTAYGSHKDSTIDELLDPLPNLAAVRLDETRERLASIQALTYLVVEHTDGRGTGGTAREWWRLLAELDAEGAADLAATVLLGEPGLPDGRVDAAHLRLLDEQAVSADPVVLAALRLAAGPRGRQLERDIGLLSRIASLPATDPSRVLNLTGPLATAIAATYDDQPLMYSSDAEGPEPSIELRDAVLAAGGEAPSPRPSRPDRNSSRSPSSRRVDPIAHIHAQLRPMVAHGAAGAIAALRDQQTKPYDDDPNAPRWESDALTNAVGWRLLNVSYEANPQSAEALLHRLVDELESFSRTQLLVDLATGIDLRRGQITGGTRLAAVAYTLAFTTMRGGGGWLTFGGREHLHLWRRAHELDPDAAIETLAAEVASVVAGRRYGTVGVTQAIVAAFADTPGADAALAAWDAAHGVIAHRLPGTTDVDVERYEVRYRTDSQSEIDAALARLAVATVALPDRSDRRRALVAAKVLLIARPHLGQQAVARALRADLGAAALTWLLRTLGPTLDPHRTPVQELVDELNRLASSDLLSVRVGASEALANAGLPVPNPPATPSHIALSSAIMASSP